MTEVTNKKRKKNYSLWSIRREIKRGHTLVPRKLDMSKFGDKADKVALILDRVYRAKMYRNDYGFTNKRRKFSEKVAINMEHLGRILHEPAAPILDMICHSERHIKNGTQPIETVLVRVNPAIPEKRSAQYVLAEPYQDKPKIHRLQRINKPKFRHVKDEMDAMIANFLPNYQKVCEHISSLTLKMDAGECDELIRQTREQYIEDGKRRYIKSKIAELMARDQAMTKASARTKATTLWEQYSKKRIEKLDEKNYDCLLFIMDKFLEMEGRDELPVYSLDEQGRLHYFLTNMTEELRPFIRLNECKVMSYDIGTSQPVFIWIALQEYIRTNSITLVWVKNQADEILETIKQCNDGIVPDFVREGFKALKQKRKLDTLEDEMKQFGKVLGKDFYDDIMQTIEWEKLSNGKFNRKKFKTKVLFPFLYGRFPSWRSKAGHKTITHYFLKKFPAVYCVLWKMRKFTEVCLDFHRMTNEGTEYTEIKEHIDKTYNPAEFPKEMQRREAKMIYNVIIPQIDQPCVTIHDSIIVQSGVKNSVPKIIKKAFLELYQIKVRVSWEPWHKEASK